LKIFVLTTGLTVYDPNEGTGGYLGVHITNYAQVQIPTLDVITDVAKELDIEVVPMAKSHVYQNWRNKYPRFQQYFKGKGIPLRKSRWLRWFWRVKCPNIHDTMEECDVCVFAYVSSAIQEAVMLGKIPIVVDIFNMNARAKHFGPLVRMVYTKEQLREDLKYMKEYFYTSGEYYVTSGDGKGTWGK